MQSRLFLKSLETKDGNAMSYILLGLILVFIFTSNYIQKIDTKTYKKWFNNANWSIEQGTKAALLQINKVDDNLESVGEGYIIKENAADGSVEKYNHLVTLNHNKAIQEFYKVYYDNMINPLYKSENETLEKVTTIAILEPNRILTGDTGNLEYNLSLYINGDELKEAGTYSTLKELQDKINSNLDSIEIRLFRSDANKSIVDLENKTYFIAVSQQLEVPSFIDYGAETINVSYFEGSNLVRSTGIREN